MIISSIDFHFSGNDLPLLKKAAEHHLRHNSPTLRLELLARWCGFSSFAAMRAALGKAMDRDVSLRLCPAAAEDFAAKRSIPFDALALLEVLASAAMPKIARENPLLHNWGWGLECLEPIGKEKQGLIAALPFEEVRSTVDRAIERDLRERREGLVGIARRDGLLRALAFVSCITPIKTRNARRSSYGLKHVAENLKYSVNGVCIERNYVSNTDLIAAAVYAGFTVFHPPYVNGQLNMTPNPSFNMSQRSLALLDEARRKNRQLA